jgi:hypothetical protein
MEEEGGAADLEEVEEAAPMAMQSSAPFTLPPLPWAMDALSPNLSREQISFHYEKHHNRWVFWGRCLLSRRRKASICTEDVTRVRGRMRMMREALRSGDFASGKRADLRRTCVSLFFSVVVVSPFSLALCSPVIVRDALASHMRLPAHRMHLFPVCDVKAPPASLAAVFHLKHIRF